METQTSPVRPRRALEAAIEFAREGDTLIVTDLSRLARSVPDFVRVQERLASKKIELRVLHLGLDTSTPNGKLFLNLLASIAQWEREVMLEREREGVAKAKAASRYKVRAPTARRKAEEVFLLAGQGKRKRAIAIELGISERSVFRILGAQRSSGEVLSPDQPA